jgi:hypothetical protein
MDDFTAPKLAPMLPTDAELNQRVEYQPFGQYGYGHKRKS